MGIAELLTIAFVILKLTGKIGWPWWQVLLPEIIAICLYVVLVFGMFVLDYKFVHWR